MQGEFGIITIAIEMAELEGQRPKSSYQQIHTHKPLFGKKGKVLNLGHLYFDFVSNFVLRISYFASLAIFTTVESSLQIKLFMQNKAKFRKSQMNVNKVLTREYEQKDTWSSGKKQSQTKPNKAKFKKAEMNVTKVLTKDYENKPPIRAPKKQSQTSKRQKTMQPSLPQRIMKKTAFPASGKTNPNKANSNPILSFPILRACKATFSLNVPIINVSSRIYVNIFLLDLFISYRYLSFSKFCSKNRRLVGHSTWHLILVRDSSCDTWFFGGLCVLYGKKLNVENELEKISGNCRIARQGKDNQ
jgi:hypothetical protein